MKTKQLLLCLLSICLLLSGCGVASQNPAQDATNAETDTTCKETEAEPIYPLVVEPTQKPFVPSNTQGGNTGEAIEYFFGSVADLELYLKTGSKNRDDYDTPPSILPSSVEHYRKYGYLAILRLLNVDEAKFDQISVSFMKLDDGNVQFRYRLDEHCIFVELATKQSLLEQFLYKKGKSFDKTAVFSANKQNPTTYEGYTLCEAEGTEYILWKNDGIKRGICMLVGDFYVQILPTRQASTEKRADCFESFMTDEKTATLAPFFKDDIADAAQRVAAAQKIVSEAATK